MLQPPRAEAFGGFYVGKRLRGNEEEFFGFRGEKGGCASSTLLKSVKSREIELIY